MSQIKRIREIHSYQNAALGAVEMLENTGDIRRFYKEYIAYIRETISLKKGGESSLQDTLHPIADPAQIAVRNICSALKYYADITAVERWDMAIPELGLYEQLYERPV